MLSTNATSSRDPLKALAFSRSGTSCKDRGHRTRYHRPSLRIRAGQPTGAHKFGEVHRDARSRPPSKDRLQELVGKTLSAPDGDQEERLPLASRRKIRRLFRL